MCLGSPTLFLPLLRVITWLTNQDTAHTACGGDGLYPVTSWTVTFLNRLKCSCTVQCLNFFHWFLLFILSSKETLNNQFITASTAAVGKHNSQSEHINALNTEMFTLLFP